MPYPVFLSYSTTPYNSSYPIHTLPYSNGAVNIVGYYVIFDPTTNIDDVSLDNGYCSGLPLSCFNLVLLFLPHIIF